MARTEFDICVIGGGAAGLVVAAGGASLGAKVALVEEDKLGGDCLHTGCVPSKTLLHTARVAHQMARADAFGLPSHRPPIDMARVTARVRAVVETIQVHDSPERFHGLGVDVIFGRGRFVSPDAFEVEGRTLTARTFVIATGSRPALPPIDGIDTAPYLTNETVFGLREPVPRLIVMGAGPIGMEMAQAFARLGSRVQVVQRGPRILPKEDPDLADVVARRLGAEGVELLPGHQPVRVEGVAGGIRLTVRGPDGAERPLEASHLLLATGRRANVESLGLEAAGVRVEKGRILTDRRLRTTNRRIYACGDVTGPHLFTHMAEHQAGVVLRNALFHLPARVERRVVPWCTFTDPELARVGLSEAEAKAEGIPYRAYRFPFSDIDRAQADGETDGFAKIITAPGGRLLGAALVGPHAGELIHEYVLAIAKGMKAADLSGVIHVYPTLAQINRRVADARLKEGLTPARRKWLKRLFRLRGN